MKTLITIKIDSLRLAAAGVKPIEPNLKNLKSWRLKRIQICHRTTSVKNRQSVYHGRRCHFCHWKILKNQKFNFRIKNGEMVGRKDDFRYEFLIFNHIFS